MSHIEIATRDDGLIVRIVGNNGEPVFSTSSQLYADEDDALNAIAVAAQVFGIHIPEPIRLHRDDFGEGLLDGAGRLVAFRRTNERAGGDD